MPTVKEGNDVLPTKSERINQGALKNHIRFRHKKVNFYKTKKNVTHGFIILKPFYRTTTDILSSCNFGLLHNKKYLECQRIILLILGANSTKGLTSSMTSPHILGLFNQCLPPPSCCGHNVWPPTHCTCRARLL